MKIFLQLDSRPAGWSTWWSGRVKPGGSGKCDECRQQRCTPKCWQNRHKSSYPERESNSRVSRVGQHSTLVPAYVLTNHRESASKVVPSHRKPPLVYESMGINDKLGLSVLIENPIPFRLLSCHLSRESLELATELTCCEDAGFPGAPTLVESCCSVWPDGRCPQLRSVAS